MTTSQINGSDLLALGFPEGPLIGRTLQIISTHFDTRPMDETISQLTKLLASPTDFADDKYLSEIALSFLNPPQSETADLIPLNENPPEFAVFGKDNIQEGAFRQMQTAMKLPITVSGALMPDAHQGYGLPIGGVLATRNAIIPFGVGVDIGCRMYLSVFDIPQEHFTVNKDKYKRELIAHTKFGAGHGFHGRYKSDHEVLTRDEFHMSPFVRGLLEKAASQLGSSGGGNHFVEFGILEFFEDDKSLNIPKGNYVALLSHSGSRGFGATVAGHYTRLAKDVCKLPDEAKNLAYFDLNSAEGQEYWMAMNLAGDYASACHEIIHTKLTKALGATLLARVENHHNFAWKEMHNGEELIVHRKGATPAGEGVLGIIPGSMTAPGFLVRGKGEKSSITSASHGAGRQMSRTQATKNITHQQMRDVLKDHDVMLIGAGLDEAPMAYKNINEVMAAQEDLVDVLARFTPKMVRMADDGSRED